MKFMIILLFLIFLFCLQKSDFIILGEIKKKAHLDCTEKTAGGALIHEPKARWCHILLLDAVVHAYHRVYFSPLVISSLRKRKFNQHFEFRNSILEEVNRIKAISSSTTSPVIPIVTPELLNRELELVLQAGPNTYKNKKRNFLELYESKDMIDEIVSFFSDIHPIDTPPLTTTPFLVPECTEETSQTSQFTFSKSGPESNELLIFDPIWESIQALRGHLLSQYTKGKSSPRFKSIVNNLCDKLLSPRSDEVAISDDLGNIFEIIITEAINIPTLSSLTNSDEKSSMANYRKSIQVVKNNIPLKAAGVKMECINPTVGMETESNMISINTSITTYIKEEYTEPEIFHDSNISVPSSSIHYPQHSYNTMPQNNNTLFNSDTNSLMCINQVVFDPLNTTTHIPTHIHMNYIQEDSLQIIDNFVEFLDVDVSYGDEEMDLCDIDGYVQAHFNDSLDWQD